MTTDIETGAKPVDWDEGPIEVKWIEEHGRHYGLFGTVGSPIGLVVFDDDDEVPPDERWEAELRLATGTTFLGRYPTVEEAKAAAVGAVEQYRSSIIQMLSSFGPGWHEKVQVGIWGGPPPAID